jgi:hypothetical protein
MGFLLLLPLLLLLLLLLLVRLLLLALSLGSATRGFELALIFLRAALIFHGGAYTTPISRPFAAGGST